MRMLVSCLIFSFLAIWSATGIVWSMTDTDCSGHMRNCTFVVSILRCAVIGGERVTMLTSYWPA